MGLYDTIKMNKVKRYICLHRDPKEYTAPMIAIIGIKQTESDIKRVIARWFWNQTYTKGTVPESDVQLLDPTQEHISNFVEDLNDVKWFEVVPTFGKVFINDRFDACGEDERTQEEMSTLMLEKCYTHKL